MFLGVALGFHLLVQELCEEPTLSLRRFEGRPFIFGRLFALFGVARSRRLEVSGEGVTFSFKGLDRSGCRDMPLADLPPCECAKAKRVRLFMFAAIAALASTVAATNGPLVLALASLEFLVAGVCVALGTLEQNLIAITIDPGGGSPISMAFRPGVVDGVMVDFAGATRAVERINALIVEASSADESTKEAARLHRSPSRAALTVVRPPC